ncbi:MAG: hypothetical protein ACRDO7_01855 [Nocardioidaceae bacterium]
MAATLRSFAAATLTATMVLTGVACGDGTGSASSSDPGDPADPDVRAEFADSLAGLPGMRAAAVETESGVEELEDEVYWHVAVDAEKTATVAQIADVLDELNDAETPADQTDGVVYLGANSTTWSAPTDGKHDGVWTGGSGNTSTDAARAVRVAETFEHATVSIAADGLTAYFDRGGVDTVSKAAAALRDDGELAGVRGVSLGAAGSPAASLVTEDEPLGADAAGAWADLTETLDRTPDDARVTALYMATNTVPSVTTYTRVSGDPQPRRLTTEQYGRVLWPVIHAQLDVIEGSRELDSLSVGNEYGDLPDDGTTGELDVFCEVYESNDGAGADTYGRSWSKEADAYLNGPNG